MTNIYFVFTLNIKFLKKFFFVELPIWRKWRGRRRAEDYDGRTPSGQHWHVSATARQLDGPIVRSLMKWSSVAPLSQLISRLLSILFLFPPLSFYLSLSFSICPSLFLFAYLSFVPIKSVIRYRLVTTDYRIL